MTKAAHSLALFALTRSARNSCQFSQRNGVQIALQPHLPRPSALSETTMSRNSLPPTSSPSKSSPNRCSVRLRSVPGSSVDVEVQNTSSFDDDGHKHLMEFEGEGFDTKPIGGNGTELVGPRNAWDVLKEEAPPMSIILLNAVAIIWGSQHAVIKMVVDDAQASYFTFLRFSLAALLASPYTPGLSDVWNQFKPSEKSKLKTISSTPNGSSAQTSTAWRWGVEMGIWMFLGFSFQAIGLGATTAQRSGFLLYLNVKLVPLFARVLFGRRISISTWLSAFAAFFGTSLLALDGTTGGLGLNVGDLWSIAAAASSAMFILRLEQASKNVANSAQLNAACLWVVAALAGAWSLLPPNVLDPSASPVSSAPVMIQMVDIAKSHPFELIYLGGVTTALANYIQTKAQKDVSAERASVIYSLDPVYGALFSYVLLGETLGGIQSYVGAGLITLAAATNALLDLGSKTDDDDTNADSLPR